MSKLIDYYSNAILIRYDVDPVIPHYLGNDFKNLHEEKATFTNSVGDEVAYFYYYYDGYNKDKIILFCHGIGSGHRDYLREIEKLASHGYKVLTLDYSGCGESSGDKMVSLNSPTRDIDELLKHLNLKEAIIIVGHSLGGYSAMNIINLYPSITKGVIISGFLSVLLELKFLTKIGFIAHKLAKYEASIVPEYAHIDNKAFFKKTSDKVLFVHSKDDNVVRYRDSTKIVQKLKNPNLSFEIVDGYRHNPNYSKEAVDYMSKVFGEYATFLKENPDCSLEQKKEFFKDVSLEKLTNQNEAVWEKIFAHIDN